ncbi:hypothetical protein SAMN04488056_101251 [Cohaesibacter marisflavi]|uniref:Uncharacterized protein n=1 Tax=Cohaesibacter marisflavi TaxID=655353 RepID=A0A1I4ZWY0_9HYPH|nr:hypothetical protein [Cohaesibacter marisflavi]SFN54633.1 hypothetical protein SAMN04488056_101251 [Cohaesibacter marisflavi]
MLKAGIANVLLQKKIEKYNNYKKIEMWLSGFVSAVSVNKTINCCVIGSALLAGWA